MAFSNAPAATLAGVARRQAAERRKTEIAKLHLEQGLSPSVIARQLKMTAWNVEAVCRRLREDAVAAMREDPEHYDRRLRNWVDGRFDTVEHLQKELCQPGLLDKDPDAVTAVSTALDAANTKIIQIAGIFGRSDKDDSGRQEDQRLLPAGSSDETERRADYVDAPAAVPEAATDQG